MRRPNVQFITFPRFIRMCLPAVMSLGGALSAGCVDTSVPEPVSAVAFCEELAALSCKVYWTCTDPTTREAQRPTLLANGIDIATDQPTCTTRLQAGCLQRPYTCGPDETYQEIKASLCVDSLRRLSCEAWLADDGQPLNCEKVCTSNSTNI